MEGTAFVESQLPDGWVPDGTAVWIALCYDPDIGAWEALVPGFSIAGMGPTAMEAQTNAFELLDDYLLLCARDGKTFDESWRPSNAAMRLRFVAQAIEEIARGVVRRAAHRHRRNPRYNNYFRLPLPLRDRIAH